MFLKKAPSVILVSSLLVSLFTVVSPASAVVTEAPKVDTEFVMPNDNVVVATDKTLDTVSDSEYVLVSAPSDLKNAVDNAPTAKKYFESEGQIVSLVTKKEALKLADSNPEIIVETDQPFTVDTVQGNATWGLDRIDSSNLYLSGTYVYGESGAGVTVYVIDSGINTSHTEFSGRLGTGYSAINGDSSVEDCNGHGTHTAGTVGGTKYGVAKGVTIVPVRVLGCNNSGTGTDILEGMQWVIDNHVSGPAVVNMSIGMQSYSQTVNNVAKAMVADGIVVAVSAGNSAVDACGASPAAEPTLLTVAATNRTDAITSWSNYGSCIDVAAPGNIITSAGLNGTDTTANMSGTSMASPHVAGVAARILGEWPDLTPAEVATKIDEYSSKGVLNSVPTGTPNKLLYAPEDINPAATPDAPTAPKIGVYRNLSIYSAGKVYINGIHATSAVPITKYTVTASLNNVVYKTKVFDNPDTAQPLALNIDGLMAPNVYDINVTATNSSGDSIPSNTLSVKAAYSRPSNVTNLTATLTSLRTYDINFTAVPDTQNYNGGLPLSGYRVSYSKTGKVWTEIGNLLPTETSVRTPQFQPNTIYYIKVVTYSDKWFNFSTGKVTSFRTSAY